MATSAGEVEVKLTLNADDFKRMMGESQAKVNEFGGVLNTFAVRLAAAFSFAAIAEFFKKSLDAYAENQLALAKLTATLGAHGIASQSLVNHLQEQARALETLTGIEETNIINAQAMLATYGLQGPVLDKATEAAANFAVRTGSLETATNLLARAYEGNTTMLGRYGIKIDQTLTPAKQFEALLGQINSQFGPVATAQANTFSGQMTALANSFHHLEEATGQLVSGPSGEVLKWFKGLIDSLASFLIKVNDTTHGVNTLFLLLGTMALKAMQNLGDAILFVLGSLAKAISMIPMIGSGLASTSKAVDGVTLAFNRGMDAMKLGLAAVLANEHAKQTELKNTAQVAMDVSVVMNKWIQEQQMKTKDDFLANLKEQDMGYSAFYDSFQTTTQQMWEFATQMSNTFFSGMGDGFARMVVEGKDFSESIKSLFRDMAEQMISYIVQVIAKLLVMFALEQATGFGAGVSSGVPFFSGMFAEGGVINEPSVITGLRSGRKILAGESGPEYVVPAGGGNQTASEMGGLPGSKGGSSSITINISGQFLEADANTWGRLVRQQIIPQIQRFTMISPTGPFNRTRGVA